MAQSLMSISQHSAGEPATTADALNKVIQWSNMTVHALQSLEWQAVGYELKPDGSNDTNRPILRCPGCWTYADTLTLPNRHHQDNCVLSNALTKYAPHSSFLTPHSSPPWCRRFVAHAWGLGLVFALCAHCLLPSLTPNNCLVSFQLRH